MTIIYVRYHFSTESSLKRVFFFLLCRRFQISCAKYTQVYYTPIVILTVKTVKFSLRRRHARLSIWVPFISHLYCEYFGEIINACDMEMGIKLVVRRMIFFIFILYTACFRAIFRCIAKKTRIDQIITRNNIQVYTFYKDDDNTSLYTRDGTENTNLYKYNNIIITTYIGRVLLSYFTI